MLTNVPSELRERPQWLCWRNEMRESSSKPTKVPYHPLSGRKASVTDPNTWTTFDIAIEAYRAGNGYNGVGFVFTANDPYTGIDLDKAENTEQQNAQIKIFEAFNTYAERSPSGNGCHIICRGNVPAGLRFGRVELYSQDRYFTFTGDVVKSLPITDCQLHLTTLWQEMRGRMGNDLLSAPPAGDVVAVLDDDAVIAQARRSANGTKFDYLWEGRWTDVTDDYGRPYPSQSEADMALVDILQFHSRNKLQIERLFLRSALARDKHHKRNSLVQYMINKSFDREPPSIDIERMVQVIQADKATSRPKAIEILDEALDDVYKMPPNSGLMNALADFYYRAAPRPVPEIALCTAIATMASIAGNAYNIKGAGLNLYLMLLAPTGVGKEAMHSGVNKVVQTMTRHALGAMANFVGPSEIASAPALYKCFKLSTSVMCILGEFGYRLQAMSDERQPAQQTLRRSLLDTYGKSGHGNALGSMAYSDVARNQERIISPALTLLCESTQSTLFEVLSERMVSDGLLPRFLTVIYEGHRVAANEHAHLAEISEQMRAALGAFVTASLSMMERKVVTEVEISPEADKLDREFDVFCDNRINASSKEAVRQLWSRAHLKARKLAALCAIGSNYLTPAISAEQYAWAKAIVVRDVVTLLKKFETGEIGEQTQTSSHNELMKCTASHLIDYIEASKFPTSMRVDPNMHSHGIIYKSYLMMKAQQAGPYRKMKFGKLSDNLEAAIRALVGIGYIAEVNTSDPTFIKTFGERDGRQTAKLYAVTNLLGLKDIREN